MPTQQHIDIWQCVAAYITFVIFVVSMCNSLCSR